MRVAFVADIHCGNHKKFGGVTKSGINARCQLVLDALLAAVLKANEDQADAFVVLGDLFDDVKPLPQIISATMDILERAHMPVHVIVGNHDQNSLDAGDHALGPLRMHKKVWVHEQPVTVPLHTHSTRPGVLLLVPYRPGAASDWLAGTVAKLCEGLPTSTDVPRALGVHLGISDDNTAPFLRGAPDSIEAKALAAIMQKHRIKWAFAGNWHQHKSWEFMGDALSLWKIVQCGALAPTGFDNPGMQYGSVILKEKDEWSRTVIPGPRFISGDYEDTNLEDIADLQGEGHSVFVHLKAQTPHLKQARAELDSYLSRGLFAGAEAVPNAKSAKVTARAAAQSAKEAGSVKSALGEYIAKLQMPGNVQREAVLKRVGDYLNL